MPDRDSLKLHTIWMISGHGVSVLLQAGYFILIGRTLGSREYGAFVGVVAFINVLSQFSSLGMEMILVRNISRARNHSQQHGEMHCASAQSDLSHCWPLPC